MRPLTVDLTGLVHTDTINVMHDDILFNFQIDRPALNLLVKSVDQFIANWPGGDPEEQEQATSIQYELRKAYLEVKYLEGEN